MTAANDPAAWQNLYIMIGTANAAITGLLFVALSLHLRDILKDPLLKPRAIVVLVVLTLQIIISAIALTLQPRVLMGVEILVLNLGFIAINLRNRSGGEDHQGPRSDPFNPRRYLWAAISLIVGWGGGFYVLGAILVVTIARSMRVAGPCSPRLRATPPDGVGGLGAARHRPPLRKSAGRGS